MSLIAELSRSWPLVLPLTAASLTVAAVAVAWVGLLRLLQFRAMHERIRSYVNPDGGDRQLTLSGVAAERERTVDEELGAQANRGRLAGTTFGVLVERHLDQAGVNLTPAAFLALQAGAIVLGPVAGYYGVGGGGPALHAAGAAAGLLAGLAAPYFVLRFMQQRLLVAFERQLPATIDAMAGSLQAGTSLAQAISIMSREAPKPTSTQLRRVMREMEIGLSLNEAMENLTERMPSNDLLLLTSAISIQSRVGGDLADIFKTISTTIRERLRIRGEVSSLTSQARYSAYVVAGMPVAIFVLLWYTNNAYISQLFLPGIMRYVVGAAVAGTVTGFFVMRKIATIDA
jgi:tight adherence protein B